MKRRMSPGLLGCVGGLSVVSLLCTIGWYVVFVRHERLGSRDRAHLDDGGAITLYRRLHLPGGDEFLIERTTASGEPVWTTSLGGIGDFAGFVSSRVADGVIVVELHHDDWTAEHVALRLDDGEPRFQLRAFDARARVVISETALFESHDGAIRRVSLADGRETWRVFGEPGRMPNWPAARGGELVFQGRVLDADTGVALPPDPLPDVWCSTPTMLGWQTSDGIARRRRGTRDVIDTGLEGELHECVDTPRGTLLVVRRAEERRLVLLDEAFAPRWDVPTSGQGWLCGLLVDGAVGQRVLDAAHSDRVLRFDPSDGHALGETTARCDVDP
ncbi:Hypothetical protein I5071_51570 [Sandaracinus amylolyticus]|nr:Hypothetical protein I5071_51570 [Sandaracinus amylolyticus]